MASDFSTDRIHPRTLAEVKRGSRIIVRDAGGDLLEKIAFSNVVRGGSFMVVWACRNEEWLKAHAEGREPDGIPWPAEDVWIPGEEPRTGESDG
jgi:hypothetical protein